MRLEKETDRRERKGNGSRKGRQGDRGLTLAPEGYEGIIAKGGQPVALEDSAILRFTPSSEEAGNNNYPCRRDMTTLAPHPSRRLAILRRQEGFTLILVLGVLLITSLLLVAAFTAANGEVHLTNTDRAEKKAYYAAEAGIEDYEYHLTQDGNYLSYCTDPAQRKQSAEPAGRIHPCTGSKYRPGTKGGPPDERGIRDPAAAGGKRHQLVGDHKCDRNHLVETMVEEQGSATGTFRIESTGYSGGEERTLVATFRNANFVSYVWYTKYETGDPVIYGEPPTSPPFPTSLPNYYTECANFYGLRPPQGNRNCGVKSPALPQQLLHRWGIRQRPDAHRGPRRNLRLAHRLVATKPTESNLATAATSPRRLLQ